MHLLVIFLMQFEKTCTSIQTTKSWAQGHPIFKFLQCDSPVLNSFCGQLTVHVRICDPEIGPQPPCHHFVTPKFKYRCVRHFGICIRCKTPHWLFFHGLCNWLCWLIFEAIIRELNKVLEGSCKWPSEVLCNDERTCQKDTVSWRVARLKPLLVKVKVTWLLTSS